ncbi:hypothetical protein AHAS_Ahas04G0104100 [Arachis hypogaea]
MGHALQAHHVSESMREGRVLELMQLKQGFMTVAEYTSKFEELCRFLRICQGALESYEAKVGNASNTKEGSRMIL